MAIMISAAQRRFLVLASTLFFISSIYICISRLVSMSFETLEEPKVKKGPYVNKADFRMSYGEYGRPAYDEIALMGQLPKEYIPTFENRRRLIVIGDIHGMLDPLDKLLKKINFNHKLDHVISVGDMVNKGPDSAGVVERLMKINASAVRGNHEDRVLLAWEGIQDQVGVQAYLDTQQAAIQRGEGRDLKTARSLSAPQVRWLKSLPVILSNEPMSMFIVHAGLVPGLPVHQQDPWAVMNMRTLRFPRAEYRGNEDEKERKKKEKQRQKEEEEKAKNFVQRRAEEDDTALNLMAAAHKAGEAPQPVGSTAEDTQAAKSIEEIMSHPDHDIWIPVDNRDGEPWAYIWNHFQRNVDSSERRSIIYGHDAKRGYQEDSYTFGLDSGCVKGHALTGLIIMGSEDGGWNQTTMQVLCDKPKTKSSWW